jgi:hypothetical protein
MSIQRPIPERGGAILGIFEAWLLLRGMRTPFPRVGRAPAAQPSRSQGDVIQPRVREVM